MAAVKLSMRQTIPLLKKLYYTDSPEVEIDNLYTPIFFKNSPTNYFSRYTQKDADQVKLAAAAALLSFGIEDGVTFIEEVSRSQESYERSSVVNILGIIPSNLGNKVLLSMLDDQVYWISSNAVYALGYAQTPEALPCLYKLLQNSNRRIRNSVINILGMFSNSENVEILKQIAIDENESVNIRISALNALGNIGTDKAVETLLDIFAKSIGHYHYTTIIALGHSRSLKALPKLLEILHGYEEQKNSWRQIRDKDTADYTDEELDNWRNHLEEEKPSSAMEYQLAYAIALIDSIEEGVKLLHHDLAKVREGAWTGLARLPFKEDEEPYQLSDSPTAVALIEHLDRERMESKNPLFRHAAYRAIDGMLITIEMYGSTSALEALEDYLPRIQDQEGVLTRVEWTIDRLRERAMDDA